MAQEKNGMLDERSKGKLRPTDLLRERPNAIGKRTNMQEEEQER